MLRQSGGRIALLLFTLLLFSVPSLGTALPGPNVTMDCPGEAPALSGARCLDGFWVINETVTLVSTHYNIEGRIHIDGNFTLPSGSSLSWRGFQKQNDSHPDLSTNLGSFILSHVNVTGQVVVLGDIAVNISSAELVGIIGQPDEASPTRSVRQPILESSNHASVSLLSAIDSTPPCRRISVSTDSSTTSSGRSSLSAVFSIDDSACMSTPSKAANNHRIVEIVAPSVIVGVLLLVLIVVLLTLKTDCFKQIVRPFSKRKAVQRESMVLAAQNRQRGSDESSEDGDSNEQKSDVDLEAGTSGNTSPVSHTANSGASLLQNNAKEDAEISDDDRRSDIAADSD